MTTIKAIKGFHPDLTCRGYQFKEGETFTIDGDPKLCENGFHAVLAPIDVIRYYPPAKSIYHEVELVDVDGPKKDDSKVAARQIKIGARIELPALIKAQIDFVMSNAKPVAGATSMKANAAVAAEVENGAATASGDYGAATASGRYGAATASGRYGAATASGYSGAATASGYYGAATASGYYGAATASGEKSTASATGRGGRARGAIGTALFLVERDALWNITAAQAVIVDGKKVKADTFYKLVAGKVVEA